MKRIVDRNRRCPTKVRDCRHLAERYLGGSPRDTRRVELRQLEYFVAVAEEANFTRAAARLHVVQSAVSTTIKNLERELGTRLLERTTKRVTAHRCRCSPATACPCRSRRRPGGRRRGGRGPRRTERHTTAGRDNHGRTHRPSRVPR
ncbi:LysR family transcriptional regulator [Streptomyces sp. NPDC000133]|uniref:LysR family transcriptional regulator n=1 Tax=Streptomyces sp. NPDC000133 TaxID=3364535 RepID=UPI00367985AF